MTDKMENNYITEILPLRVLSPRSGSPVWGCGIRRRNPQNIVLWRSGGLDCRKSTGREKTERPLLEDTHKALGASGPRGKSGDFIRPDLPADLGGSPGETGGTYGSLWGQGHWWQSYLEVLVGMSCRGDHHFDAKTWPHPPLCWEASG